MIKYARREWIFFMDMKIDINLYMLSLYFLTYFDHTYYKPFGELTTRGSIGFRGKHGDAAISFRNVQIKEL